MLFELLAIPDWIDAETLIVFAMAIGGVWVMVNESRMHRREADERIGLHARLATLEASTASQAPHTIAERVAALEAADAADLRERVAAIETRIDYVPPKPTVPRTPAATPKEGKAK